MSGEDFKRIKFLILLLFDPTGWLATCGKHKSCCKRNYMCIPRSKALLPMLVKEKELRAQHVQAWWGRSPEFGLFANKVMAVESETAKLPCVVYNLHDKSVTWMRKRDLHILTAGQVTYTADDRFQVVHAENSNEWTLVIRYVQPRDAGVYECQVNTDPKISRPVTLSVKATTAASTEAKSNKVFLANNTASTKDGNLRVEIKGARELFIEEGSSLTLACEVTSSPVVTLVYWYHGNTLIDYNSPRGGVALRVDRRKGITTATLLVSSVGPGDSGMYSCVPTGSHPASVLVHVQKGEQQLHEAAIQQSGVNSSAGSGWFTLTPLLMCTYCLFRLGLS